MSLYVEHNGKTIIHPGVDVYVDVAGMVRPNIDISKVGAIVGEAPNGEPGLHVFADAESARQFFGDGSDLADGINLMVNPSNDERVTGGASLVYAYKANQSTRAERFLVRDFVTGRISGSATGSPMARAKDDVSNTEDGAWIDVNLGATYADDTFNNMIVEIIAGWGKGQQFQIADSSDQGSSVHRLILRSDLDWDQVPNNSVSVPLVRIAVPQSKLMASEWGPRGELNTVSFGPHTASSAHKLNAQYSRRTEVTSTAFGGSLKPTFHIKFDPTGGGALSEWTNTANWIIPQATDTGLVGGTTTSSATQTLMDGAGITLTADAHINRWLIITGVDSAISGQADFLGKMYKLVDNGTANVTLHGTGLTTSLTGANLAGMTWKVFALTDVYLEVTGANGLATGLQVYVQDGATTAAASLASVDLTLYPTLSDLERKLDALSGIEATVGEGVDRSLLSSRFDFGPLAAHQGIQFKGQSSTNYSIGATSVVLSTAGGLDGTTDLPTSGYPYYLIANPGGATESIITVTANDGVDTLTVSALTTAISTGNIIVRGTNAEQAFEMGSNLILGPGETSAGFIVQDSNAKLVEDSASTFQRFVIERVTDPGSTTTISGKSVASQVGATFPESDLGIYKNVYHGEIGESVVNIPDTTDPYYPISYKDGLNRLLLNDSIRVITVTASESKTNWTTTTGTIDTLAVAFQQHLLDAEAARAERQGYMGLRMPLEAGTYYDPVSKTYRSFDRGLLDWSRYFNEERLSIWGQNVSTFTSGGVEEELPPWAGACIAAGIQMGTDVGEGLTFKRMKVTSLSQPFNDWEPKSVVDSKKALLGGLLYGESSNGFWRIVRGLTTHVATGNLARTDINVWEIRNLVIRTIRETLEERFIGEGIGAPGEGVRVAGRATRAGIREAMSTVLTELRSNGYIVDSTDASGRRVNAWTALQVSIVSDIAYISVQVFPKTALNYVLVDFAFQTPRLTA